ncbi:hypothetical protein ASD28_23730 [Massilia sp. Root133]|uniref:Uncharacterized protein n=1 Tax=Massilia cellulosiltytica TaxID=2683234 RepID=A0A7X3FY82_9BURK|nr:MULTISPECIES: hypothetical protein [Telluria group]KQY15864.1 hypothetical protein ASD28_23730 [Massilia sp. Root133]KQZ44595.1 hypothetical protein ASD92_29100 [Massilia sp. Root1485]MVW59980.1 hypothetical protein [Telluria cellulosilytica]
MNTLIEQILEAHGGLARWQSHDRLSAHLSQGGILWPLKGHGGKLDEVDVQIDLKQQWTSHAPFGAADRRTAVTPRRAVIETVDGQVVEVLDDPRASFAGFGLETPWSDLQLAYFVGYAMWNYLTLPFAFAEPGFGFEELPAWEESGERWHRLRVTYPDTIATHSRVQTFYVGTDYKLRRHDYDVDINGGTPAVHYFSDYTTVDGIALPTRHLIHVRNPDGGHAPDPLVVSIAVSDVRFG